jgi:hypothetical protein
MEAGSRGIEADITSDLFGRKKFADGRFVRCLLDETSLNKNVIDIHGITFF